ncbi:hypothetical protein Tco_0822390 [Tanacetum coccineum]|uniref:Uncharacterized protein n=1 Tax=Tanacetum coccineum TaxID=301880 RepID=A0ABQ5AEX0_9ASTR
MVLYADAYNVTGYACLGSRKKSRLDLGMIYCLEISRSLHNQAIPTLKWIRHGIEIIKELRTNAFNGDDGEDVVDHIIMVPEILDLIKIPDVDSDQLRIIAFLISLGNVARRWWIEECDGKVTTWVDVVKKFFYKLYPLSRAGRDRAEVYEEPDYNEFSTWLHKKFIESCTTEARTKCAMWDTWIEMADNDELNYLPSEEI